MLLSKIQMVGWILFVLLLYCPALMAQPPEETPQWRGVFCPQKTYLAQAVTDKGAWESLWQRSMEEKAPALDFSKYVAAAIFLGEKPTGGYVIEFGQPRMAVTKMIIPFKVIEPERGQFVAQMLTQPFYIKAFPRMGAKEVAVEKMP